jgi:hypothetical protein
MGGACNTNVEKRNAYGLLVVKPEGKRPLGRHRWEDKFRMPLRGIGWGGWTGLIWFKIGTGRWLF